MVMLTDEKLEEFGILTRARKGEELTHEEMDRNISVALDAMVFNGVCHESLDEYPAILNAPTAAEGDNVLTPVTGYCAVRFPAELAGMQVAVSGNDGQKWVYSNEFADVETVEDGDVFFITPDSVLVFRASGEAYVTLTANDYGYGG